MSIRDDDVKQAIGQVAKLGGFNIKRMATTDDLKDHTITITITRTSDGWHQERLAFEDEIDQVATVDANGHVEKVETTDPSDLTEKDETLAATEPDPDDAGDDPKPEVHLVGEAAAAGRKRR